MMSEQEYDYEQCQYDYVEALGDIFGLTEEQYLAYQDEGWQDDGYDDYDYWG